MKGRRPKITSGGSLRHLTRKRVSIVPLVSLDIGSVSGVADCNLLDRPIKSQSCRLSRPGKRPEERTDRARQDRPGTACIRYSDWIQLLRSTVHSRPVEPNPALRPFSTPHLSLLLGPLPFFWQGQRAQTGPFYWSTYAHAPLQLH